MNSKRRVQNSQTEILMIFGSNKEYVYYSDFEKKLISVVRHVPKGYVERQRKGIFNLRHIPIHHK